LTKRSHRRRTWTVQSYSPGGANVHPYVVILPWTYPSPQPKRHLDRFSGFSRVHDRDRQTDRQTSHVTPSVTIGRIYVRSTAMRPKIVTRKLGVQYGKGKVTAAQ